MNMSTQIIIEAQNPEKLALALSLLRNMNGISICEVDDDYEEAEEARDLALIAERRHETPIDWETAKKMLAEGAIDAL
jgi:hypothetical protein